MRAAWRTPARPSGAWSAAIGTVFVQAPAEAARAQWRWVTDQLRDTAPKLSAVMGGAETDVLASMTFPRAHWTQINQTNPLERLNEVFSTASGALASSMHRDIYGGKRGWSMLRATRLLMSREVV